VRPGLPSHPSERFIVRRGTSGFTQGNKTPDGDGPNRAEPLQPGGRTSFQRQGIYSSLRICKVGRDLYQTEAKPYQKKAG